MHRYHAPMSTEDLPCWLGSRPIAPNHDLVVHHKIDGTVLARVPRCDAALIDQAIAATVEAAPAMADLSAHDREAILLQCADQFAVLAEDLTQQLCAESGKPIADCRVEVGRLIETFRTAAGEALRIGGEVLPLDVTPAGEGWFGMWKRVPIGPCSFISPFNFPLNLVAHKIAPAIAAGCPFILKPASLTPLSALSIGEVLAQTDLPEGAFSILPCSRDGADLFTTDERLKLLSFTGSPDVGWALKAKAGKKKVVLELGGNAACIVEPDFDLDLVVPRLLKGAFAQSGQSCISVQRVLAHRSIHDELRDRLVEAIAGLKVGDPREEDTTVGPLITEADAERLLSWIEEAREAGARVLTGGTREGATLAPTLLTGVPGDARISCEEAFGPALTLDAYDTFEEALARTNDSAYGLQAGVFTRDLARAHRAWDVLEVGGVIIGNAPSWRADHMPYGGVKDSGLGREGPRFAIEDMTEPRMLAMHLPDA